MSIFTKKKKTQVQIKADKKAQRKREKDEETKRKKEEKKLENEARHQELKARIERAKAEKVTSRNERLRQLPVVGRHIFGSNPTKSTTRRRKRSKVLGRGSGWGL